MLEINKQIGNNNFTFKKLSAVDALKTQQLIIQKIKADEGLVKALDEIEDESAFILFFINVLQGFDPEELINTITTIFTKADVKVETVEGIKHVSLNRDFADNFNEILFLAFEVLKANYRFDFFLQQAKSKMTPKNTIKVPNGENS